MGRPELERRVGDWHWTATGGGRRARIWSAAGRRPVRSAREEASVRRPDGGESVVSGGAAPAKRVDADAGGGGRACGGRAESRLGGGVPSSCAERRQARRTHVIGTGAEQEGRTQSHRGFHQVVQSFAGRGLLQSYGSELCHTTTPHSIQIVEFRVKIIIIV